MEKKLPKYDSRHWMGNFTTILAVEKGTPAFNLFFRWSGNGAVDGSGGVGAAPDIEGGGSR